jgi:sulfatase maturation enzyme AslB (radical SAM superfamily)
MENLKDKDLYDDLRIQLIIDSNCNLACEYCVLLYKNQVYKEERSISYQVLDKYITFFIDNYDLLLKYYRKITLTFF